MGDHHVGEFAERRQRLSAGGTGARVRLDATETVPVLIKGLVPRRGEDTLTFGVARTHVSEDAAALDADTLRVNGWPYPIRDSETVFELSYVAQIAPWLTVQPDLQYVLQPGGNVPDPSDPGRIVGDALVIGVRTSMAF